MKKHHLIGIICLSIIIWITGCSQSYYTKRDIKRLDGLSLQYAGEFARLSNILNPCFTGHAKSDTVIKRSSDTVFNSVERYISGKPGKPDTIYLPGKTIKNNIFTIIHDTIADNRAITACAATGKASADSLLIMKIKRAQLVSDKSSLIKWVIGMSIALLTITAIGITKFLNGGSLISGLKKVI